MHTLFLKFHSLQILFSLLLVAPGSEPLSRFSSRRFSSGRFQARALQGENTTQGKTGDGPKRLSTITQTSLVWIFPLKQKTVVDDHSSSSAFEASPIGFCESKSSKPLLPQCWPYNVTILPLELPPAIESLDTRWWQVFLDPANPQPRCRESD